MWTYKQEGSPKTTYEVSELSSPNAVTGSSNSNALQSETAGKLPLPRRPTAELLCKMLEDEVSEKRGNRSHSSKCCGLVSERCHVL